MTHRTILVTGGAGFIGSALAARLAADEANFVVAVDNFSVGTRENLPHPRPANYAFVEADVNDPSSLSPVFREYRFDYVFHYAAIVGVQRTLANPAKVLAGIDGIKAVLTLAKDSRVKRVYYSSSSEVYGEPVEFPQHEHSTPLNGRHPYAIVKSEGEACLRHFHREFGLDYTIFRFFNVYGPGQRRDFVIGRFVRAALDNEDITIHGDGSQRRAFCFIDDNIDATVAALTHERHVNDVVNIGTDAEISILDLARTVVRICRSESRIVHVPPRKEGDISRRRPDTTKMRALLGRDFLPLEAGLRRIVAQRSQPSLVSAQTAPA